MPLTVRPSIVPCLAACAALSGLPAGAVTSQVSDGLTVSEDKAAFMAASGATDASGALPDLGFIGYQPYTAGTVTFLAASGHPLWIGTGGGAFGNPLDWTGLLPGHDIAVDGSEYLGVATATPVHALGFDFVEPDIPLGQDPGNIGSCWDRVCVDSTFRVQLFLQNRSVGSFEFNAPDNVAAFVGMASDTPFDYVVVSEVIGSGDDEYFGHVYTSATAAVPEPATWMLWGAAGLLTAVRRRPRRG